MSPIRRVQEFPKVEFKTIEEANEWAKKLTDALHEDTTLRSYDIDSAITTTSHNHAASDINSGTLVHEQGGLEADVSAYTGYVKITGGATSNPNAATIKTDLSLNLVENTALSSWAGTTNVTTLGTIATGTWNGTDIDNQYITSDVRFRAYLSTNQTNISSGISTKIQLNTEDYDTGSDFDNATLYRFVAPVTGWYDIHGQIRLDKDDLVADKRYSGFIYLNATTQIFQGEVIPPIGNVGYPSILMGGHYYLTATDYIELYIYHVAGVDTIDVLGSTGSTYMCAHLMST